MFGIKGVRELIANQCDSMARRLSLKANPTEKEVDTIFSLRWSRDAFKDKRLNGFDITLALSIEDILNIIDALLDNDRQCIYFKYAMEDLIKVLTIRTVYAINPNIDLKDINKLLGIGKR